MAQRPPTDPGTTTRVSRSRGSTTSRADESGLPESEQFALVAQQARDAVAGAQESGMADVPPDTQPVATILGTKVEKKEAVPPTKISKEQRPFSRTRGLPGAHSPNTRDVRDICADSAEGLRAEFAARDADTAGEMLQLRREFQTLTELVQLSMRQISEQMAPPPAEVKEKGSFTPQATWLQKIFVMCTTMK